VEFYGRVLDQFGNPVSNAEVDVAAIDKFDAAGSHFSTRSDSEGNFTFQGIHGAVITVGVSKPGYYNIHGKSDAAFAYGVAQDSTRRPPPTKDERGIFVLQKQGETEPLVRVANRHIVLDKAGMPVVIDVSNGRTGRGSLQIKSFIGDTSQRRFDWRYELSVNDGGLTERIGQFDFQAPSEGYRSVAEISAAANSPNWSSDVRKEFFARLPGGQFARLSINFYPGNKNFIVMDMYLNPSGSRNLEYDPAKEIKAR
jgi:hypothetical protein